MNAEELLEELTYPTGSIPAGGGDVGTLRGGMVVRAHPMQGIGGDQLGAPSKVVQRELVIKGQRFLVQVISLAE